MYGWGAQLEIGDRSYITYGSYWIEDGLTSSNQRETTAVLRALLAFRSRLEEVRGHALVIRTDNMVTVFNLRWQGASGGKLLEATRAIFTLLTAMDIRLQVSQVPGVENAFTDALSRMDTAGDYALDSEVYRRAIASLSVTPTIDLFAARANSKLPRFAALPGRNAQGAEVLDALGIPWTGETPYLSLRYNWSPGCCRNYGQRG
jgi:hypothetical protein